LPQVSQEIDKSFIPKKVLMQCGGLRMKVFNESLRFSTRGEIDFVDLTDKVQGIVTKSGIRNGLAHVFAPHATGILILTEYEPSLMTDLKDVLEKLLPKHRAYRHPSNAHSHLRSVFLCPDRTLPVVDGRVVLGTWQSLVFVETDVYPRQRTVIVQVIGE
jgi:secondary thiamine-phosphate synthase enzyme